MRKHKTARVYFIFKPSDILLVKNKYHTTNHGFSCKVNKIFTGGTTCKAAQTLRSETFSKKTGTVSLLVVLRSSTGENKKQNDAGYNYKFRKLAVRQEKPTAHFSEMRWRKGT